MTNLDSFKNLDSCTRNRIASDRLDKNGNSHIYSTNDYTADGPYHYKKYFTFLGSSDKAQLMCHSDSVFTVIYFNIDSDYQAWVVYDYQPNQIPNHYQLKHTFENDIEIWDDDDVCAYFKADKIEIYRAGMQGVLINLINSKM